MSKRWCSKFTWISEAKIVIEIQCKHILLSCLFEHYNVASNNDFCHGNDNYQWYYFSQRSCQSLFWYCPNISTLSAPSRLTVMQCLFHLQLFGSLGCRALWPANTFLMSHHYWGLLKRTQEALWLLLVLLSATSCSVLSSPFLDSGVMVHILINANSFF